MHNWFFIIIAKRNRSSLNLELLHGECGQFTEPMHLATNVFHLDGGMFAYRADLLLRISQANKYAVNLDCEIDAPGIAKRHVPFTTDI